MLLRRPDARRGGGLGDVVGLADLGTDFLDEHRIERTRILDHAGCATPVHRSIDERLCDASAGRACPVFLAVAPLPPFRQYVGHLLERWGWWRLALDKLPGKRTKTTTPSTTPTTTPTTTGVKP